MTDVNPFEEDDSSSHPRSLIARLAPWLVLVALALLFVPLYVGSATIEDAIAPMATESESLQATITAPPSAPAQEQTLTAHLLELRIQLAALENVPPTLIAAHIDWPAIMSALHSYDANRIQLTSFNHDTNHLTLQGIGLEESAVLEYTSALQATGFFSGVQVQSITLNPIKPVIPGAQTDIPVMQVYMPFIFTVSVDLIGNSNGSQ